MVELFSRISESPFFKASILSVIVISGIIVGVETHAETFERYGDLFLLIDGTIVALFLLELLIRLGAHGEKPQRFFQDGWNVFDFIVVILCVAPWQGEYIAVSRVARILRLLRLVTVVPRLQLLVRALLRTLPSISYVSLLLVLHFYVYAVVGVFLFGKNDPVHFGTLPMALVSLFRVLTLEDWTDIMYIQMYGSDQYGYDAFPAQAALAEAASFPLISVLYFISFVLLGTMIILNLFVGVMMNGVAETTSEAEMVSLEESKKKGYLTVAEEMKLLSSQIDSLKGNLQTISVRLTNEGSNERVEERRTGTDDVAFPRLRLLKASS